MDGEMDSLSKRNRCTGQVKQSSIPDDGQSLATGYKKRNTRSGTPKLRRKFRKPTSHQQYQFATEQKVWGGRDGAGKKRKYCWWKYRKIFSTRLLLTLNEGGGQQGPYRCSSGQDTSTTTQPGLSWGEKVTRVVPKSSVQTSVLTSADQRQTI